MTTTEQVKLKPCPHEVGDRVRHFKSGKVGTIVETHYPGWVDWRPDDWSSNRGGALRTDPSNLKPISPNPPSPDAGERWEAREAIALESWREEIGHPNNRLLFKRMVEKAGIDLGVDDIASALRKVAALSPAPDADTVMVPRVSAVAAFEMGYQFAFDVTRPQSREDSRAIGRLLMTDAFAPIAAEIKAELDRQGFDSFKDADHGIAQARSIINAALAASQVKPDPLPAQEGGE